MQAISDNRIDPRSFTLDGGLPPEAYVFAAPPNGTWLVYYSERGMQTGLRTFTSEGKALDYLLQELLGDPSTRITGNSES